MTQNLLTIQNLSISFDTYAGTIEAVRNINLSIRKGEIVGLVGESGCGKSVASQSILGILPSPPAKILSGSIIYKEKNLLELSEKEMESYRGQEIAMIFQDPMTSLNPTMRVGKQITEAIFQHRSISGEDARKLAMKTLQDVGISDVASRFDQYPHQYSGGMRQRAMIAMALVGAPSLLVADEPTTALDVTIQAQILELMKKINQEKNTSILLITHDLGVVAGICDRVLVMYAGKIVEEGPVGEIFSSPKHPYTRALLNAVPCLNQGSKAKLKPIHGSPPNLMYAPKGCPFAPRCQFTMSICKTPPPLYPLPHQQSSACWLHHPKCPTSMESE